MNSNRRLEIELDIHPFDFLDGLSELVVNSGQPVSYSNATPLSSRAQFYTRGEVEVQPFVTFDGPVFLGHGVRIGPYSLLRGPLFVEDGAMIGPYCEVTRTYIGARSILAHKVIIPDTIIAEDVWVAGGVYVCNTRLERDPIRLTWQGVQKFRPAFGAMLMTGVSIGAKATIMPGAIIKANVLPMAIAKGIHE